MTGDKFMVFCVECGKKIDNLFVLVEYKKVKEL